MQREQYFEIEINLKYGIKEEMLQTNVMNE